eukprot:TRINITY_DN870_c0_g1_i1.p1 TRINITY_DN870_c0_g1~~TRINITY_DN870_c0_g1_i1.p1  ORF type:complete len:160 (+),score=42.52 TRINITY_DN870_c0_g1_i1:82-561(+)
MEIRSVEGYIDFDSDLKASEQLQQAFDRAEFLRETKAVFNSFAKNGRATKEDVERWLRQTKFREQRGKDRTRPCEMRVEIDATFRELDISQRGYITLHEFRAYHLQRFEHAVRAMQEEERAMESGPAQGGDGDERDGAGSTGTAPATPPPRPPPPDGAY